MTYTTHYHCLAVTVYIMHVLYHIEYMATDGRRLAWSRRWRKEIIICIGSAKKVEAIIAMELSYNDEFTNRAGCMAAR